MTDRDEAVSNVVEGIEEEEKRERGEEQIVTLSTGVELKVSSVPKNFLYAVTSKFERPKVPTYFNEGKGREEENPDDPDYQEALDQYIVEIANASNNVVLLRGTQIERIPEGFPGPDSKEWIEEMEALDLPMINNSRVRYLAWVKGMAAPLDEDITLLMEEIGRLTGVTEADVADAVDRFQR
ncbi:hypothetical protein LCGC14_1236230 [marine sediment metagenome]|uniref:Uncharacterized protein n=1 Tax=marine sediment metagenome TaxID=412755 RepID=A0A0F9L774_9ZZZZ